METGHVRSVAELSNLDPTTARFSPIGLLTQGSMTGGGSARYLQEMLERARLSTEVPEGVRQSFERVRELHIYGLFQYGFFTIAEEAAWAIPESALGFRFLEHYLGQVRFVHGTDRATLNASGFRQVAEALAPGGRFSRRDGWREGHEQYEDGRSFDGSYWALMQSSRREGLLKPWLHDRWTGREESIRLAVTTRVRPPDYAVPDNWHEFDDEGRHAWWDRFRQDVWERDEIGVLVSLRNLVAHSPPGRVVMPVNSASALITVAGFVNGLWPASALTQSRSADQ